MAVTVSNGGSVIRMPTASTLTDIFRRHGTDKGEYGYGRAYEVFLAARRDKIWKVLEVGIGTLIPGVHSSMVGWAAPHYRPGGSLRSWHDYFPNAEIIGIDTQPDTQFSEERIRTYLCDSTDSRQIYELSKVVNLVDIDFIVDDGSHYPDHQIQTLKNLFPFLAPDGIYIIEDIAGNGLFERREEISEVIGDAIMFWTGMAFSPVFIRRTA